MSMVSPESIFQQAARFHVAQAILRERAPDYPPQVLEAPHCVLAAFTIELMLKGLICHERGGAAPRGHDLLALFDQLSARTRERLQTMWTDLARRNRDEFEAVKQETGVTLEPELRLAGSGEKGVRTDQIPARGDSGGLRVLSRPLGGHTYENRLRVAARLGWCVA
jgi:hypothetical protein